VYITDLKQLSPSELRGLAASYHTLTDARLLEKPSAEDRMALIDAVLLDFESENSTSRSVRQLRRYLRLRTVSDLDLRQRLDAQCARCIDVDRLFLLSASGDTAGRYKMHLLYAALLSEQRRRHRLRAWWNNPFRELRGWGEDHPNSVVFAGAAGIAVLMLFARWLSQTHPLLRAGAVGASLAALALARPRWPWGLTAICLLMPWAVTP
jgi:hypothetical protein